MNHVDYGGGTSVVPGRVPGKQSLLLLLRILRNSGLTHRIFDSIGHIRSISTEVPL